MTRVRVLAAAARSPVASARAAAWAWSEAHRLGRSLRRDGFAAVGEIRRPPALAAHRRPVVSGVLRLSRATCLVRSAVLQRWDADHDRPRPLVVGVAKDPAGGFAAHAWLEGEAAPGFVEIHRRPPS